MYRYRYFHIVIAMLMIAGCKSSGVDNNPSNSNDPFSTLPTNFVATPRSPIDSNIDFYFIESITTTGKIVSVTFMTEHVYNSGGYTIVGNSSKNDNQIDIQLDSIKAPGIGPAINVPATASFQLGNFPNDLYTLTIRINGQKIQALLLVSDTSFITKVQPNSIIATSRPRLLRIPTTVIWGQAESIAPSIQQQFIDSLKSRGAKSVTLPLGNYYYFSVLSADSFYIPSAMGMRYGQYFLYQFNADTSVSRNLVKNFAKKYGDSIYVSLFGGRGEMYYTTVLKLEP